MLKIEDLKVLWELSEQMDTTCVLADEFETPIRTRLKELRLELESEIKGYLFFKWRGVKPA